MHIFARKLAFIVFALQFCIVIENAMDGIWMH